MKNETNGSLAARLRKVWFPTLAFALFTILILGVWELYRADAPHAIGMIVIGDAFHRLDQAAILDVPGKCFETDLGRFEPHLGRTPQPSGIVRDPHHPQRRRMIAAGRPHAERFERLDRWPHQGRRTVVAPSLPSPAPLPKPPPRAGEGRVGERGG